MFSPVIPLILLVLLLPIYIVAEYKSSSPWLKIILKAVCSLFFVAAAVAAMSGAPGGWQSCFGLFLAAFLFSMVGDVLLSLPVKQSFPAGLGAFLLAQCFFTAAFIGKYGLSPWDSAVYALLAGGVVFTLLNAPGMDYGKMRIPAVAYALALCAMTAKAVSGVYLSGGAGAWVAAAGGLLFFASDVMLAFIQFNRKKPAGLRAWNLFTYYTGQGLLALSLYL